MTSKKTLLAELIDKQVGASLIESVDGIAEEIARDMLRDPAIRKKIHALVMAAFERALADLQSER